MSKFKFTWICVMLAIIMALGTVETTYSTTLSSLNSQKNDLQTKLDTAKKELEKINAEKSEVEKQVSQLNAQIEIYQGEIDTLESQITENEVKLAQAQEKYEKRSKTLANRMIAQYESGDITYLDVLVNSESLSDFISNYYMIGEIAEMDVSLIKEIEQTKKEIEETKRQLEADRANILEQKNTLQAKKSERETYKSQLSEEAKELQRQSEKYDEDLRQVREEISKFNSGTYIGSGRMQYPVPGYTIGDRFGMRLHPIYHVWKLHTGVDIAAPIGAKFVAAESGTVKVASNNYYGYGKAVVIDHGGGITTLYGHCSALYVSVGQYVTKGTTIAAVGSTGVSTGPHAHFEVRINGTQVDPEPYIKK